MKAFAATVCVFTFAVTAAFGAPAPQRTDHELLDETEALACRYFLDCSLPNGLVMDSNRSPRLASIAATGFGFAALAVAASRAESSAYWTITPETARARVLLAVRTLEEIQNKQPRDSSGYGKAGFFYHFIGPDGKRAGTCEVSTVDTALLIAGMLTAAQYFGGEIATRTAHIFQRLDWNYFLVPAPRPCFRGAVEFSHGWSPEQGRFRQTWDRPTDETMLICLLALARQPENREFQRAFFSWPRVERRYDGISVCNSYFGSLFTYVFAHCFYDFKAAGSDAPRKVGGVPANVPAVDWWQNSLSAAVANRRFCIHHESQYPSYGRDSWGLSPCYAPDGRYLGQSGAAPAEHEPVHDGTVPPYGAVCCLPFFTTKLDENPAFLALRHYHDALYPQLWGPYGPKDSFNLAPSLRVADRYLGIDVGPMVLMMENFRTRFVWHQFMRYPGIREGMAKVFVRL